MSRAWRAGLLTLGWLLLLAPIASAAESTGVDKAINDALGPFAEQAATVVFWGPTIGETPLPLVVILLVGGAIFFSVYNRFINLPGSATRSTSRAAPTTIRATPVRRPTSGR